MAWGSVATLGSVASGTADQSSLVLNPSASLEVGNVGVVWIAIDNNGTTDADFSEVTSVTDSGSNTWTKAKEFTNGQGAAQAGATGSMWYTKATGQVTLTTGNITANFANATSCDATALSAWEFTIGAGSTISVAGSATAAGDAVDPAAITISGLTSAEYLWLWLLAIEAVSTTTITQDADYTAIDKAGQGAGAAAMTVGGGFRIFTGTTDTVDAATSQARDHVQLYVALKENAAATSLLPASKKVWRGNR